MTAIAVVSALLVTWPMPMQDEGPATFLFAKNIVRYKEPQRTNRK